MKKLFLFLLLSTVLGCTNDTSTKRACTGTYDVEYLHVSGQVMTKRIHVPIDCENIAVLDSEVSENDGSYWSDIYKGSTIVKRIYGATDIRSITFVK